MSKNTFTINFDLDFLKNISSPSVAMISIILSFLVPTATVWFMITNTGRFTGTEIVSAALSIVIAILFAIFHLIFISDKSEYLATAKKLAEEQSISKDDALKKIIIKHTLWWAIFPYSLYFLTGANAVVLLISYVLIVTIALAVSIKNQVKRNLS
jgi:hypothetical protein